MAGKKLTANVVVINPETGLSVMLTAGKTVPDWAEDQVTNPAAFAKDPYAADPGRRRAAEAEADEAAGADSGDSGSDGGGGDSGDGGDGNDGGSGDGGSTKLEKPPVSGTGSGEAAWKAYADQEGISYAKDAKKADIIAAVGAAGSGE